MVRGYLQSGNLNFMLMLYPTAVLLFLIARFPLFQETLYQKAALAPTP